MTVQELIEKLSKYPGNLPVMCGCWKCDHIYDVTHVEHDYTYIDDESQEEVDHEHISVYS